MKKEISQNRAHLPQSFRPRIIVCDINSSMLQVGEKRAKEKGYMDDSDIALEFLQGDAECLPVGFLFPSSIYF